MKVFKLQLWCKNEDESIYYIDLYLDVEKIIGFCMAKKGDDEEETINIFLAGDTFSIKPEKHITDYLTYRFIKAINARIK